MSWEDAWKILEPLSDWPEIRRHKIRTLYELATEAQGGCIVELGAYHGLGAINLALGARDGSGPKVYTVDDFLARTAHAGQTYVPENKAQFLKNILDAGVDVTLVNADIFQAADTWTEPIALLVGDTGDHSPDQFFQAWGRHIVPGGVFAHKMEEPRPFNFMPADWRRWREVPAGLVYSIKKNLNCAALWIVTEEFVREAEISAASLARFMPDVQRCLFSPDQVASDAFTRIVRLSPRESSAWYADCCRYVVEALEQLPELVLYLDSDTYFMAPVPELFEMANYYCDLAMCHAPGRRTAATVEKIPECFPEWNIGVMVMRNCDLVQRLWRKLHAQLAGHLDVYKDNDQAPFREVLWRDRSVRVATITPEYNCRFPFGCFVTDPVKILHGRGNYAAVAESINSKEYMRLWRDCMML